jgi:hypothetical protein
MKDQGEAVLPFSGKGGGKVALFLNVKIFLGCLQFLSNRGNYL